MVSLVDEVDLTGIGGKSYGTREQCSQKIFELTENIRKISLFKIIDQDIMFNQE
jgi:hypothetical protein